MPFPQGTAWYRADAELGPRSLLKHQRYQTFSVLIVEQPVWPSGKALGLQAYVPRVFDSLLCSVSSSEVVVCGH